MASATASAAAPTSAPGRSSSGTLGSQFGLSGEHIAVNAARGTRTLTSNGSGRCCFPSTTGVASRSLASSLPTSGSLASGWLASGWQNPGLLVSGLLALSTSRVTTMVVTLGRTLATRSWMIFLQHHFQHLLANVPEHSGSESVSPV